MLKLKKYLKPYALILLAAIVFLFGQAMLEFTLPNYMSDIVNVGLQQGGITQSAPKAISAQGMAVMQHFMNEGDKAAAANAYAPLEGVANADALRKTYPNLTESDLVLTADPEASGANGAFARASYALVKTLEQIAPDMAANQSENEGAADPQVVAGLISALGQPQVAQIVEQTIAESGVALDSVVQQTGVVLAKTFYTQLGADTDAMQTNYILKVGAKMLGLTLLLTACAVGAGFCLARLGAGVGRDLRRDVFKKVTFFNSNEMDKFSGASLITRSTNDITQVQNFLGMGLRMMCFAPIMGIGGLIMGLSKSVSLAWVLALALVLMLGLIGTMFVVALPRFKKMQKLLDRLNLVSREELSGMMVVRAFANQNHMQKRFDSANKELTDNTLFVSRAMAVMMPLMTLVMNGISLLIIWFGGKQIAASNLQVGDMMAFLQYAMHVIMSFLFISMMFILLPRASVSAERINEVLQTEGQVRDPETPKHLSTPVKGVVSFNNVSFSYPGADANVLENISFTAHPGKTTAFIGSTGSGKSTLVNLIARFYDASAGSITLDGVNLKDLPQQELRETIGYVPQKGLLFSGTIDSNLRYGAADATDEQMQQSIEIAQATDFISKLDEGLETEISQGGTNVSGGQRQRLSIARALVKNSPIYIFDDTFSALDFKTDAALRKALKGYTENATVFIVTQRVSTILEAEQIVVLDEGKVMGIGTHKQLLESCQEYREIAESQLSKEELA